jgi:ubiquinone/menaquinone biosynthesis C-methylase UbiE
VTVSLIGRLTSNVHSRLVLGRRVQVLARHAAELVPEGAESVLDLGCGDGSLARLVMERRPELTFHGLEIRARPVTAIPVQEYDGFRIPCPDRSYDVVLVADVLHHAEDALQLIREAARVARRAVIIKDHLSDPWLGAPRLSVMDWVGNIGHGVPLLDAYWSRKEWSAAFAEVGLRESERRESLGLYPLPIRWLFEDGLHFMTRLTHT